MSLKPPKKKGTEKVRKPGLHPQIWLSDFFSALEIHGIRRFPRRSTELILLPHSTRRERSISHKNRWN